MNMGGLPSPACNTLRDSGEQHPALPVVGKNDAYPAGIPLRANEIKLARNYRHRSIDGGEYL